MADYKPKILCVEDEVDIRENISEILRDENFEVAEAENGKEGFQKFLTFKPDLVISDIMMPELDGYGFLKMVRESKDKNNSVPFIFLSALGQKDNIIKGVELSANDYLIKPIDFDILIAKSKEKTANSIKIKQAHQTGISNMRSQIATLLPSETFSFIETIIQLAKNLKEEPYGPFPHRRYMEDITKIYNDATKLKTSLTNNLDQNVIENRINPDEEIFSIVEFIKVAIQNFPANLQKRIDFEAPFDIENLPKIKMDKTQLVEFLKRIIVSAVKMDVSAAIKISLVTDTFNRIVIIFYLKSSLLESETKEIIEEKALRQISDSLNCELKVTAPQDKNSEINIILAIPRHRLVE